MTAHATVPAEHTELARKAWARRVLRRQVEVLGELAEIGLRIARAAGDQAAAPGAANPANDHPAESPAQAPVRSDAGGRTPAMAYARAARAVRLTLMLQTRTLDELRRLDMPEAPRFVGLPPSPEAARKTRVQRIVRRVARLAHGDDEAQIDRLSIEAGERLDDEDLYRDILDRPLGELVASLCRDLGLDPDWARLAGEAWAGDEWTDPRSPFRPMVPPVRRPGLTPRRVDVRVADPRAGSP